MYQALYRKWRPQSFADVVGQSAVTDTLAKQVETGHTSHAYLFSGSRGTGKTTCAKILSKAINCENPFHGNPCNKCPSCLGITGGDIMDVVEIDAASNNGVDYVRDLRDEAIYSPANVKKRVYIIDEVHMFSSSAFNALLKIMEEPPEHVVFILATTELNKVPATVASRCQRFVFKRIPLSAIEERLQFISRSEGYELAHGAAKYIASLSDGAMRDALSLLDQCASVGGGNISDEVVESVVGLAGRQQTFEMALAIAERDIGKTLGLLNDIYTGGKNLTSVLGELSEVFRDALILKTAGSEKLPRISARYTDNELLDVASRFDSLRLCNAIDALQQATSTIASSSNKRIDAELCCVRLCEGADKEDVTSLVSRVSELERKFSSGSFVQSTAKPSVTRKTETTPVAEKAREEAPVPKTRTEEKPTEPQTAPREQTPVSSGDAGQIWEKILAEAKGKLSPGVLPLFAGATARLDGNKLFLSNSNAFVLQMLSRNENLEILRSAAGAVAPGIIVSVGKSVEAPKADNSGIDELIQDIGDFEGLIIK